MSVTRLGLQHFRNIREAQLEPSPGFNFILGPNGSGKTSLLEAIHYLGVGRSFRTNQNNRAIQDGENAFVLHARKQGDRRLHHLGMQRDRQGQTTLRLDGETQHRLSQLAEVLPLQLITPESFELLTGGPANRRQYLDWGVFHVEQDFLDHWGRARRLLKQRNALLKQRPKGYDELSYWDGELARHATALSALRQAYVAALKPVLAELASALLPDYDLQLDFNPGWDQERELGAVLASQFQRDLIMGHTGAGPHKAELRIKAKGTPVQEIFSRGELKLLVCAMKLAQAELLSKTKDKQVSFLIDDLPSELDGGKRRLLTQALARTGAQVFVTAIDADKVDDMVAGLDAVSLFHVKQGQLSTAHS